MINVTRDGQSWNDDRWDNYYPGLCVEIDGKRYIPICKCGSLTLTADLNIVPPTGPLHAFIREPFSRLISAYAFRYSGYLWGAFVDSVLSYTGDRPCMTLKPQSEYLAPFEIDTFYSLDQMTDVTGRTRTNNHEMDVSGLTLTSEQSRQYREVYADDFELWENNFG